MSTKTDSEGQADRVDEGDEFRSTVARAFARSLAAMGLDKEYDVVTEYAVKTPHAGINGVTKLDVAFLRGGNHLVAGLETKTSARDRRKQVTHDATILKAVMPSFVYGFCYRDRNAETNGGQPQVVAHMEKFVREYGTYFPRLVDQVLCSRADNFKQDREKFIGLFHRGDSC